MARLLVRESSQYLQCGNNNPRIGYGDFSIHAKIKLASLQSWECIWSNGMFSPAMYARGMSNKFTLWNVSSGYTFDTTLSVDTLYSIGVARRSGVLYGYLNGVQEETTPAFPSYISGRATTIGWSTNGAELLDGEVSEVALWDAGLTTEEFVALHAGLSSFFIRHSNLIAYWSLGGLFGKDDGDLDYFRKYDLTAYNNPGTADHPSILYPTGPLVVMPPPPVGGGGSSPHHTRRRLRGGMIGMGV